MRSALKSLARGFLAFTNWVLDIVIAHITTHLQEGGCLRWIVRFSEWLIRKDNLVSETTFALLMWILALGILFVFLVADPILIWLALT